MTRNVGDFNEGQTGASDSTPAPSLNPKAGSFHKGRNGYYRDHHSSNTYMGGCNKCKSEEKAGKHPLA